MHSFMNSPIVMLAIILVIVLLPITKILQRTGHSPWWGLLLFIPPLNLIGLWVLAFVRWPAVNTK